MNAELFAFSEKKLQTQTNAQERATFPDNLQDRLDKTTMLEIPHAIGKRADSRQYDPLGLQHYLGVAGNNSLEANLFETLLHGTQVTHAVIDYCDHKKTRL
jgi:hypothetical protein